MTKQTVESCRRDTVDRFSLEGSNSESFVSLDRIYCQNHKFDNIWCEYQDSSP